MKGSFGAHLGDWVKEVFPVQSLALDFGVVKLFRKDYIFIQHLTWWSELDQQVMFGVAGNYLCL